MLKKKNPHIFPYEFEPLAIVIKQQHNGITVCFYDYVKKSKKLIFLLGISLLLATFNKVFDR